MPVLDGRLALGTWQSICLVDLNVDNAEREVRLSFLPGLSTCGAALTPPRRVDTSRAAWHGSPVPNVRGEGKPVRIRR